MAQWNGQFSGNSHKTKVLDLEHMLTHSVDVFKSCSEETKSAKGKAVRKLAAKLLNGRLKMVKANLSETIPVEAKNWEKRRIQFDHLIAQEQKLESEGIAGILIEFDVEELIETDP